MDHPARAPEFWKSNNRAEQSPARRRATASLTWSSCAVPSTTDCLTGLSVDADRHSYDPEPQQLCGPAPARPYPRPCHSRHRLQSSQIFLAPSCRDTSCLIPITVRQPPHERPFVRPEPPSLIPSVPNLPIRRALRARLSKIPPRGTEGHASALGVLDSVCTVLYLGQLEGLGLFINLTGSPLRQFILG